MPHWNKKENKKKRPRKGIADFTQGNVTKQLMLFAFPLFLSNLLQVIYNMADMVIVGQNTGSVGLSAVSVGGDTTNFMTFLAMGFSNAGQVIISQMIGAKRQDQISRFVGTMAVSLLGISLVISAVVLAFRCQILAWMNTPAVVWDSALDYVTICTAGLFFIYG